MRKYSGKLRVYPVAGEAAMGARRQLTLTEAERAALVQMRDRGPKAYLRERAAALVKIADGAAAAVVARSGLLRRRAPDTLYAWMSRFQAEGIAGLTIRAGRGRKAAFSPSHSRAGGGARGTAAHRPP